MAAFSFGGVALQRELGPRSIASTSSGTAPSGAWFCPHGGGPGWEVTLQIANPGPDASTVRVITYSTGKPTAPRTMTLQAGTTMALPVPAGQRASSSLVEWFGAWIGAGWIAKAGNGETGEAAEPCAPQAGSSWLAPDGNTKQGERAFLIVMDPFAADADLTLQLQTDGPPFTPGKYNPFILRSNRSVAIDIGALKKGFSAVAARVSVASGRVAVASLGVSDTQGIRSVIGTLGSPATTTYLSSAGGSQATVVAASANEAAAFSGTLLQSGQPQPLNGLTQANLPAFNAHAFTVSSGNPSTLRVDASEGAADVVSRIQGPGRDQGATGGSSIPAGGWLVMPTVAASPSHPGLVLTNPGTSPITVALRSLSSSAPAETTVNVPPTSAVGAPASFLAKDPTAAVLATSTDGTFLATGASASGGVLGLSSYSIAQGVPVPEPWLGRLLANEPASPTP